MKTLLAMFVAILLFAAGVLLASHVQPHLQSWLSQLGYEVATSAPANERKPIKYRHPMNPTIFSDTPAQDDMGMDYIPVYADGDSDSSKERKPIKYRHPMNPTIFSDTPAQDDMGMDYIPVYADGDGDDAGSGITISPEVVNNLGVRTAPVERGNLARQIETIGYVDYDERTLSHVHLRASGWVENLKVRTLGERVRQGDLLMEVYAPDLVNAQEEYAQSLRGNISLLKISARDRLLALGVSESQIQQLEKEGRARQLTAVYARQDGLVSALNIREGMYVMPQTELMTLADPSTVWIRVEVFEQQASWLAVGQKAEVRLPHQSSKIWKGKVEYIYPDVDPKTRTLRIRLRFPNPDERLKFNMFTNVTIETTPRTRVLHIPREALISTGVEQRVMVALGEGRFEARPVKTGIESGSVIEIVSGLKAGEQVVTSAQFLLDSESSIRASLQRLTAPPKPEIWAEGVVNTIETDSRTVNMDHAPIPELGWSAMTMDLPVAKEVNLGTLKPNSKMRFRLRQGESGYEIDAFKPMGAKP